MTQDAQKLFDYARHNFLATNQLSGSRAMHDLKFNEAAISRAKSGLRAANVIEPVNTDYFRMCTLDEKKIQNLGSEAQALFTWAKQALSHVAFGRLIAIQKLGWDQTRQNAAEQELVTMGYITSDSTSFYLKL